MVLKLSIINQVKAGAMWFIRLLVCIIAVFVVHKYLRVNINDSLLLLLGAVIFSVMPAIFAHIWYANKSENIEVALQETNFTYSQGYDDVISYDYGEIEVVLYNKFASYDTGYYVTGIEPFRNLQIFTTD